jgi:anti-sigma-K factor RskA
MTDNDTGRQERAALYALGALGDEERKAFEQDLAGSPSLRRDVESSHGIADELAQAGSCKRAITTGLRRAASIPIL